MTTAPFLYFGNKDLKIIQQIVTFTKVANIAKQATSQIADLVMMVKKKQIAANNPKNPKTKKNPSTVNKRDITLGIAT